MLLRPWDLGGLLYYMFLIHLGQISDIFVFGLETKGSDGGGVGGKVVQQR